MDKMFKAVLVRDPEVRYANTGTCIVSLRLVENIGYGDKQKSLYIDAKVWGKQGETPNTASDAGLAMRLNKGDTVVVTGMLTTDEWDKQDGTKGSKIVLSARTIDKIDTGFRFNADEQETTTPVDDEEIPF